LSSTLNLDQQIEHRRCRYGIQHDGGGLQHGQVDEDAPPVPPRPDAPDIVIVPRRSSAQKCEILWRGGNDAGWKGGDDTGYGGAATTRAMEGRQ
jgi:hypothetical protein